MFPTTYNYNQQGTKMSLLLVELRIYVTKPIGLAKNHQCQPKTSPYYLIVSYREQTLCQYMYVLADVNLYRSYFDPMELVWLEKLLVTAWNKLICSSILISIVNYREQALQANIVMYWLQSSCPGPLQTLQSWFATQKHQSQPRTSPYVIPYGL